MSRQESTNRHRYVTGDLRCFWKQTEARRQHNPARHAHSEYDGDHKTAILHRALSIGGQSEQREVVSTVSITGQIGERPAAINDRRCQ